MGGKSESQMKVLFAIISCVCVAGCGDERSGGDDLQTPNKRVRDLICSIQTNPTAKVVFESAAIRTNLQALTSKEERCRLISDWTDALLHIEVEGLSSAARASSISVALHLLEVDAYWLMRDAGADCRELWDYRFRVLDWLDGHIARMNPEKMSLADNENDERQKWWNYLLLIEKREMLIEGWENVAFDPLAYDSGAEELEGIRRRFEQKLGRVIRKNNTSQGASAILSEVRKNVTKKERMALEAIRAKRNDKTASVEIGR